MLLGAAAACLTLVPFLMALDRASFHLDETGWILASSRAFETSGPSESEYGYHFGWPAPPIGKYLMGASLRLREESLASSLAAVRWSTYDRPIIASMASGQIPPVNVLVSARLPMAILGAATCLVVFAIGKTAWGTRAGLIAAALLALNPLMLTCCRRAMIDAPAIFFSSLAILLCARLPAVSGNHVLVRACGIGAAIGLALASKLNALATAAACLAIIVLIPPRGGAGVRRLAAAGIAAIVAAAVFVAVNPYLYADPVGRAWSMLTFRYYEPVIVSLGAKAALVARRVLLGETDPTGTTYLTLRSLVGLPLEWALIPAGCAALAGSIRRVTDAGRSNAAGLAVLVWWGATLAAIVWWLPQDWERYYLPALPPTILIAARGLDRLLGLLPPGKANRLRRDPSPRPRA
jgi:4-amino-4-deoxy-L-arabinose transferase-like glycosyltransferase